MLFEEIELAVGQQGRPAPGGVKPRFGLGSTAIQLEAPSGRPSSAWSRPASAFLEIGP